MWTTGAAISGYAVDINGDLVDGVVVEVFINNHPRCICSEYFRFRKRKLGSRSKLRQEVLKNRLPLS
jgi:hypothetical protein